ncbi:acyl-ACP thioesterase domain-containing protein [Iamia sp.]|uniref:acyl-ACP thioesterase domain-containing protein n=1 Tax=Iamia sp. TaxID=2722710 RepID=UPI002D1471AF|nr:acyl-ACP thioesterase domain-containing protein [Iamia sp.]HXH57069.1 acyl-ACP thioesterase domain-containing protein [Iamia sp.]
MSDRTLAALALVPVPDRGRRYSATRRVRWGDVDRRGRLRLDALARYLQDVANDDTRDAGHDPMAPWVVRRTGVRVVSPPTLLEDLTLTTFNGGIGSRWAERRTSITGDRGGHVETASLWIFLDPSTNRPARLTAEFLDTYAEAAMGRTVKARLSHGRPPDGAERRAWPLRSTDHDPLGHVNNAATWAPVEDELDRRGMVPRWAEVEYGDAIGPTDEVELFSTLTAEGTVAMWLVTDGAVRASAVAGSS